MNAAHPLTVKPLHAPHSALSPPLRLALADGGDERRRASLYRQLMSLGKGEFSPAGDGAVEPTVVAPPLRRGRMVPERTESGTLRGVLLRVFRLALRLVAPAPERERG